MANNTVSASYVSSADDFKEHQETYRTVMRMTKWTVIGLAIVLVLLYLVIRP